VTSVHDVDGWSSLEEYEAARASGELVTRIYACAPLSRAQELARHIAENGVGDSWIRTGCVKGFMDGSLGSHTAAFFEPYDDTPNDRGFLVDSEQNLERLMRTADEAGLQLAIHAIGDRAINVLLNIFSRIVSDYGPRDRRLRIEHAQHIAPADFDRFSDLGVIPSMQPYHAIDDGRWAEEIIGPERSKTTYAFRSLIDAGAHPAFGSDWFVAPPTPLEGIYAAVTRRTLDDENPEGWVPEQKISVEEALRAYTIDAARASFEEDVKGTLETGKLADFVILDRDITRIPPEEIRDTQVVMTVVGGRVVYRRDL
jgi:predicted amidohydrolase YtcJ